jgi:hypothetical protein
LGLGCAFCILALFLLILIIMLRSIGVKKWLAEMAQIASMITAWCEEMDGRDGPISRPPVLRKAAYTD